MKQSAGKIKNQNGFTLIELIVVIVIIAILAAVTVPSYTQYMDRQMAHECDVNMDSLVLYLSNERIMNPQATMADLLSSGKESVVRIQCPSGGEYYAYGNSTVKCSRHAELSSKAVSAE